MLAEGPITPIFVLGPFEVENIPLHGAIELAPRRTIGALPAPRDATPRLDEVQVAVLRVEVDAVPDGAFRHFARV